MSYVWKRWGFLNSIEHEYSYAGKYGAKGERREKRKKPTPEQVRRQNQINKENRIRRTIKANFLPSDLWCTLKYPKGTRKQMDMVKDDMKKFLDRLRYRYRRQQDTLKFIYRIEIGKLGGIHIHILVNRTKEKRGADALIAESWIFGHVHFTPIYEYGGYKELASYIAKPPPAEQEENEEAEKTCHYSSSRNLIRPEPEVREYSRRTMRKIIEHGPEPTPGFYIDEDSVIVGTNRYTGMSYMRYTEYRIKEIRSG